MHIRISLRKFLNQRIIQKFGNINNFNLPSSRILMRRTFSSVPKFQKSSIYEKEDSNDVLNLESEKINSESNLETYLENQKTAQILKSRGIDNLFPIQMKTFDLIYNKTDVIAKDRTGSGKTLAYSLPLIEKYRKNGDFSVSPFNQKREIKIMVLMPTRELCLQVSNEFEYQIHNKSNPEFNILSIYGGVDINRQITSLSRGVDVVVATPGRMLDLINRGKLNFSSLDTIILDEVDEMLNMGFKEDIERIIDKAKSDKGDKESDLQYLFFSATVPRWVKSTAKQLMKENYHYLDMVKSSDMQTSTTIEHIAIRSHYNERLGILKGLISRHCDSEGKTIIFTETKMEANEIYSKGFKGQASLLHGDVSQSLRELAISNFREGKTKVLVATSIAARGLDIKDVDLIIQVSMPDTESYIHRSGRTARAGKSGKSIILYSDKDTRELAYLENFAKIRFVKENPPTLDGEELMKHLESELQQISYDKWKNYTQTASYLIEKFGAEEAISRILAKDATTFSSSFEKNENQFQRGKSYQNRSRSSNSYRNNNSNSNQGFFYSKKNYESKQSYGYDNYKTW